MKKIFFITLILVIIFFGIIMLQDNGIPEFSIINNVEVHIGGVGQEENTNLVFYDGSNIEEIRNIHSQLNGYKDPKVCTWFLDVELRYKLNSGKKKVYTFKKVRPVNDYFAVIYNSLEYKRQVNPIYKLSEDDITHVIIRDSYNDRHKEFKINDKEIVSGLLSQSIKAYDDYDNNKEYYLIADVEFYHGEELLANSMILREQAIWYDTLKANKELLDLYVSVDEVKEVIIEDRNSGKKIITKDSNLIRLVLDNYFGWHSNQSSQYSVELIMKDKTMRHWYGSFLKDAVPNEIVSLFD